MNAPKDGGPAFPHHFTQDSIGDCVDMTLRDYFAAMAMQGFCAGPDMQSMGDVANDAYAMADWMLKAREVKS